MTAARQSGVKAKEIYWYLSARLPAQERLAHAKNSGGVIVRGLSGAKAVPDLRRNGFEGPVLLDPAAYERIDSIADETLFGDRWAFIQQQVGVTEYLSPGVYVEAGDVLTLRMAFESQARWLENLGTGRASIAIDAHWLTDNIARLLAEMAGLDFPVAIALAHRNDPLSLSGSVRGLVELLAVGVDIAIVRGDMGALGSVVHGASLGAFGTSAAVRHVVPPGRKAGGAPGDRSPSVFIPDWLDFRLGSFLDSLPRDASPICSICCEGRPLRRFNDESTASDARLHNMRSIRNVIDTVLALPVDQRAEQFKTMCQSSVYAVEAMTASARRPLEVRSQIKQWAALP